MFSHTLVIIIILKKKLTASSERRRGEKEREGEIEGETVTVQLLTEAKDG